MTDDSKKGGSHESHEKGVETTKERHGKDFYQKIGEKGGESRGENSDNSRSENDGAEEP